MGRALLGAVTNWKRANRLLSTDLDTQITNARGFLADLRAMKPWPDHEQSLQLCMEAVEKELRRLEQRRDERV